MKKLFSIIAAIAIAAAPLEAQVLLNGRPFYKDIQLGGTITLLSGTTFSGTFTVSGGPIVAPVGSAAAPSYTFTGDTGTGWYRSGASEVALAAGGALSLKFTVGGSIQSAGGGTIAMPGSGAVSVTSSSSSSVSLGSGATIVTSGTTAATFGSDQSATFAGQGKFNVGLSAIGALTTHVPASIAFDYAGTSTARIISYGADSSTNGSFSWVSRRSDGSSQTTPMTLTSAGTLTTAGSITGTFIQCAINQSFYVNGRLNLWADADGVARLTNNAATSGVVLDVSTDSTLKVRNRANNADAAVTTGNLTIGGGSAITKVLTATASLDFGSTAAQSSGDLTITVTGAAVGDTVTIGVPDGSTLTNSSFSAWVSASNTVKVRFNNYSSGALDPASGTFRATVVQF